MRKEFYRNNKINMILSILGVLFYSILYIAVAFISKRLFDIASKENIKEFYTMIFIAIGFIVLFSIVIILKRFFYNNYIRKAILQYKNYAFKKLLSKSVNSFNDEVTGKYISLLTNDINTIENGYVIGTLDIIMNIVMLLFSLVSMFYLNWLITICIIIMSFLPILVSAFFGSKLKKYESETSDENQNFVSFLKDALTGFSVIKSFKAELEVLEVFFSRNICLERKKNTKNKAYDLLQMLSNLTIIIIQLIIIFLGVYLTIKGNVTIGTVIAFSSLINTLMNPLSSLGALFASRKAAKGLIEKMEESVKEIDLDEGKQDKHKMFNGIEYTNVSFAYEDDKYILNDINCCFKKGKSYAIVGASGSGKSTLVNLLLGYHDNFQGNITIDDTDIRNISNKGLYDIISVIHQNTFIFDTTIKNNITMYKEYDDNTINQAIKFSGLSDFIREKGTDYLCGENGCNLSGGENQRITIARCLIRKTPIIIMDEGTSALDSKMTQYIEENILNCENVTRIVVSHNMNEKILKRYDEIIVLHHHKIVESGTFDELINNKEYFKSLYNVVI